MTRRANTIEVLDYMQQEMEKWSEKEYFEAMTILSNKFENSLPFQRRNISFHPVIRKFNEWVKEQLPNVDNNNIVQYLRYLYATNYILKVRSFSFNEIINLSKQAKDFLEINHKKITIVFSLFRVL